MNGIDDAVDGPRVRQKRLEQAQSIADKVQTFQSANPDVPLFVVGDLNAFEFTDGYVDVMGQLTGTPDPEGALLPPTEELSPPFTNLTLLLPAEERYSLVYRCSAEALDHVLVNRPMGRWVQEVAYARGNADAPREWFEMAGSALRVTFSDGEHTLLRPADLLDPFYFRQRFWLNRAVVKALAREAETGDTSVSDWLRRVLARDFPGSTAIRLEGVARARDLEETLWTLDLGEDGP